MVEYKLKNPIVLGEETVEVLHLEMATQERLEQYDFDYSELSKARGLRRLVCACARNVTEAHVMKMNPVEIAKAGEICASFFE